MLGSVTSWFVQGVARPGRPRLYCFPHSGGSAAEFIRWSRHLPRVEIRGVQPPGRGLRRSSVPTRMTDLVASVTAALPTDAPYSVFGHSLGAVVAYEVTRALHAAGRPLPDQLIVSSFPAPSTLGARTGTSVHTLPDDELLDVLGRRHGGIPPEVLADPALKTIVARNLRADYQILHSYAWQPGPRVPVPVVVFGGMDDGITPEGFQAWQDHTTEGLTTRMFPGGHFYFRQHPPVVMRALATVMDEPHAAAA
jgi:surfactin synthase thioesterase subunit